MASQPSQQIKATTQGQATAVIALTASILEEDRAIFLSAGCEDFKYDEVLTLIQ